MSKISTSDCRKFIVEFAKSNPTTVLSNWDDPEELERIKKCLTTESKWKRHSKWKPGSNHDFAQPEYPVFDHSRQIPAGQLAWVREFYLNPTEFENSIGFQILEDIDGNLIMGQDIGD